MKKLNSKNLIENESGFSLFEILISLAIFSFLILVSIGSFSQANLALKRQSQATTRSRLIQSIIYVIGLPATIRTSAQNYPVSDRFYACSLDRGPTCYPGTYDGVTLYLPPVAATKTTTVTSGPITGPPNAPLKYTLDGVPCKAGEVCLPEDYPISVQTEFDIVCPPAYDYTAPSPPGWPAGAAINPAGLAIQTSCWITHYMKIRYSFFPTPGGPPDAAFTPVDGVVWISTVATRVAY